MPDLTIDKTSEVIQTLDSWVRTYSWKGIDPYDIWGHRSYRWLSSLPRALPIRACRYALFSLTLRLPQVPLSFIRPDAKINAKAMGLFAQSYVKLFNIYQQTDFLTAGSQCLDELRRTRSKGYKNYAWGYPFDWYDVSLLPKGTPSSVVTSMCGTAFLDALESWNIPGASEVILGAATFLAEELPYLKCPGSDEVCLSYTPITAEYVHNANLLAAAFLARVGRRFQRPEWLDLSRRCARYAIRRQQPNGSFYYFGPEERRVASKKVVERVDHYHTGFVIRSLLNIAEYTGMRAAKDAACRASTHYLQELFDGPRPKLMVEATYPIDIHSCSEALLCLSRIASDIEKLRDAALRQRSKTLAWILENMWDNRGWFAYRRYRSHSVRIPFMRWGQAWMLRALTEVLEDEMHAVEPQRYESAGAL